jgi:translation initiation factor eIF-2B subunit delta
MKFEMKENDFEKILTDNVSGSIELVLKINRFLQQNFDDIKLIKRSLKKLNSRMRSFAVITNYISDVNKFLADENYSGLKKYLDDYYNLSSNSFYKIYLNIKPLLGNKRNIFTLSNSKTVFEVLKYLHEDNKHVEVVIAESRPAFEGRMLAKKLLKFGIKVTLIPDSDLANCISKCDAVLIGADKIFNNGDAANKTGSCAAAIIAKYFAKPFYVVASETKITKQNKFIQKLQNPKEIWEYRNRNLKIENYYFEIVPKNLITKIITELKIY